MRILLGSISVLPTHVGVILLNVNSRNEPCCTTHTRGGDPREVIDLPEPQEYYPHTWG